MAMLINFLPESDLSDFTQAISEYKEIWINDGEEIINNWEQITGLKFKEKTINACIFHGVSHSHPLSLKDSVNLDRKKSLLIHELGHRILFKEVNQPDFSSLENHKTLFLVLYDVWAAMYGKDFADQAVEIEKMIPRDVYQTAWNWALTFSKEERVNEFKKRLK